MKLLVLSASTGGGHDMRAFALRDWWVQEGRECEVFHPLETTFWGYRAGCQLYNIIQKKLPLFHFFYFHFLEYASMHRSASKIIGAQNFVRKIELYAPDLIVSTHAHLNHGYFELSRLPQHKPSRFVVFCGELADGQGFSKHWINPRNDLFVTPFKEGSFAARRRGMPPEKTLISGPLLRKPFYSGNHTFNRSDVFQNLDLDPNLPVFLLGTGANGVNHHVPVIRAINQAKIDCQILALCGRNEKTFGQIKKLLSTSRNRVVPFAQLEASSMIPLLKVATWILARPGAGLTTEAMVTGCPVIFDLSGGCMPQEKNTLNFWKAHAGSVVTSSSPSQLIDLIRSEEEVPQLNIPLQSSPHLLLNTLVKLGRSTQQPW